MSIAEVVPLAIKALETADTVSQEVIDLANGVRVVASDAAAWTTDHEAAFQTNVVRLTGTNPPPVPTVAAPAAAEVVTTA